MFTVVLFVITFALFGVTSCSHETSDVSIGVVAGAVVWSIVGLIIICVLICVIFWKLCVRNIKINSQVGWKCMWCIRQINKHYFHFLPYLIEISILLFRGVCLTEKMHNIDGNERWLYTTLNLHIILIECIGEFKKFKIRYDDTSLSF